MAVALVLACGCATTPPSQTTALALAETPPPAPREFRAAWVATVANIDWPSKSGLPVAQQRAEMIAILEKARSLNLNAIILQVRPAADALYISRLEPWSEYLTGTQGKAPTPYYDPLRVWIQEAHARGLELHAWLNPYRAKHSSARSPLARSHLANVRPEAVKTYGDMLWMDPGEPAAVKQTLQVVRDITARYDVDGIHIDDYFYPYPITTAGDFPDGASWERYVAHGGKLSRADWRRENVNTLIAEMHRSVHALKPWVRLGVSPFGIGRPDRRPPGIAGFSQYDSLYADVELWLQQGWLDYLSPQLYWPIAQKAQAFPVLLDYWAKQNPQNRHIWPGLIVSSVTATARGWSAEEIGRQIEVIRTAAAGDGRNNGHVHFSMVALMQDRAGVATLLQRATYAQPALVPATPWLASAAPRTPRLVMHDAKQGRVIEIRPSRLGVQPANFAVWKQYGTSWRFSVQPAADRTIALSNDPDLGPVTAVVVSSVDRLGNESPRAAVTVAGGRAQ